MTRDRTAEEQGSAAPARPTPRQPVPVGEVAAKLLAQWEQRCEDWARFDATVKGAIVAAQVVEDLRRLATIDAEVSLSLAQAARQSGYSADHLGRLVRQGKIPNAGRPNAPRIRLSDVPRKAAGLPAPDSCSNVKHDRGRIARSIANPAA